MRNTKLTKFELLFLIITSVVIMTVVTTSSPIYRLNVWDDANVYFSLGRGIIEGHVPYRDLYEQKGPLFLFMYAAAALISRHNFTGVWLFECIGASVFSIFTWKQVKLFVTDIPKFAVGIVPMFISVVYTMGMFNFGGGAEEFGIPLLSIVFYVALKMIREKEYVLPDKKDALICGIVTSMMFWTKYTFLGFVAAFIVFILVIAIKKKAFKALGQDVLFFLLGFAVMCLPVFIYFIAKGSLSYLFDVYFYNNIFNYYSGEVVYIGIHKYAIVRFFTMPALALFHTFKRNPDFTVLFILTVIGIATFEKKYRKRVAVLTAVLFFVFLKFLFTQATFIYYYGYVLTVFFTITVIMLVRGVKLWLKKKPSQKKFISTLLAFSFAFVSLNMLFMCKNLYLLRLTRDDYSQFVFADIINETEDPKIFTYDIIDGGFYLTAGVSPSNRYFTTMNFIENNEEAMEEQQRLISEGYFDYIITYSDEYDWANYELVTVRLDPYCDYTKEICLIQYSLYQRVD